MKKPHATGVAQGFIAELLSPPRQETPPKVWCRSSLSKLPSIGTLFACQLSECGENMSVGGSLKGSSSGHTQIIDPFLTPATLAMALWPSGKDAWVPAPHLLFASAKIANAILKGNGRLIVSMPPQHGKSRLVSETTIPWFLQKFPKENMMLVAYNQDFSEEWGGKVKDTINNRQDLFNFTIRDDRSRVDRFETSTGSTCWFSGINSGQTGKGASLIIIDDYIKNIDQAMSPAERAKIWRSFIANIDSRTRNGTTIIIVATRWWSDDLIGRLLKHFPGEWENICFPAIAEENDILGRKPGEALFPALHSVENLARKRRQAQVAGVIFDALYQQRPVDENADYTDGKWLQIAQGVNPSDFSCCRSWDFASKQGGGDFTTGLKMGRKGHSRQSFIFNIIRKQLSPMKVEELIRRTAVADGPDCTILLEQEPGSQAASLIEHYKVNVLPEFEVIAVPAGNKSKLVKAQPFIGSVESGNVFLVENSMSTEEPEWIQLFREEFDNFPPPEGSGMHDDQVDTASICFNHLFQPDMNSITWGDESSVDKSRVVFGIGSYGKLTDAEIARLSGLDATYGDEARGGHLITGIAW